MSLHHPFPCLSVCFFVFHDLAVAFFFEELNWEPMVWQNKTSLVGAPYLGNMAILMLLMNAHQDAQSNL